MGKMKTIVTALGGVLVGGMLLSGGLVFAGDTDNAVSDNLAAKMPFFGQGMKHRGGMMGDKGFFKAVGQRLSQETLEQLVTDGVIDQAKADEIKEYIDKLAEERQAAEPGTRPAGRQDLFTELVTNNILTQEQADTIKAKIKEIADQQHQQKISDSSKILVEQGTITQDQADKILNKFDEAEKERESFAQKMEDMTLKEIREYVQNNKEKTQNPIDQLVSEGVITQEQADAFQTALKDAAQEQNQQVISDRLKTLVEQGTITQEQADKVLGQLESSQNDRQTLFEEMKDMTPEERRQYMEDNMEKPQNPIIQLVEDGAITQEQADAIGEVLPFKKGPRGGRR